MLADLLLQMSFNNNISSFSKKRISLPRNRFAEIEKKKNLITNKNLLNEELDSSGTPSSLNTEAPLIENNYAHITPIANSTSHPVVSDEIQNTIVDLEASTPTLNNMISRDEDISNSQTLLDQPLTENDPADIIPSENSISCPVLSNEGQQIIVDLEENSDVSNNQVSRDNETSSENISASGMIETNTLTSTTGSAMTEANTLTSTNETNSTIPISRSFISIGDFFRGNLSNTRNLRNILLNPEAQEGLNSGHFANLTGSEALNVTNRMARLRELADANSMPETYGRQGQTDSSFEESLRFSSTPNNTRNWNRTRPSTFNWIRRPAYTNVTLLDQLQSGVQLRHVTNNTHFDNSISSLQQQNFLSVNPILQRLYQSIAQREQAQREQAQREQAQQEEALNSHTYSVVQPAHAVITDLDVNSIENSMVDTTEDVPDVSNSSIISTSTGDIWASAFNNTRFSSVLLNTDNFNSTTMPDDNDEWEDEDQTSSVTPELTPPSPSQGQTTIVSHNAQNRPISLLNISVPNNSSMTLLEQIRAQRRPNDEVAIDQDRINLALEAQRQRIAEQEQERRAQSQAEAQRLRNLQRAGRENVASEEMSAPNTLSQLVNRLSRIRSAVADDDD